MNTICPKCQSNNLNLQNSINEKQYQIDMYSCKDCGCYFECIFKQKLKEQQKENKNEKK